MGAVGCDLARRGTRSGAMSAMPPVCTDAAAAPPEGASGSAVAEGAPGDAVHGPPRKDRAADPGVAAPIPRPVRIRYGTVSRFHKSGGKFKLGSDFGMFLNSETLPADFLKPDTRVHRVGYVVCQKGHIAVHLHLISRALDDTISESDRENMSVTQHNTKNNLRILS